MKELLKQTIIRAAQDCFTSLAGQMRSEFSSSSVRCHTHFKLSLRTFVNSIISAYKRNPFKDVWDIA